MAQASWFVKYEKGWSHSRKSIGKTAPNSKTALCELRDEVDVRPRWGHFYSIARHFANEGYCSKNDRVSKQQLGLDLFTGSRQAQALDLFICKYSSTLGPTQIRQFD